MNHTSRSVVTATRKRKDRGEIENSSFYKGSFGSSHHKPISSGNGNNFNNNNNNNNINTHTNASTTSSAIATGSKTFEPGFNPNNPAPSNRLLAGYMAHEFLTKGTLFGQKFDPARAEAVPVSAAEPKRKPVQAGYEPGVKPNRNYADVAQLLKEDGAHIPGIVNPTQLARWIQG